ncbi:MAG: hypothetical protein OXR73_19215 [Myxococcales bacterium]|nr:hypothetical protein [Myxococcales bacterium]
MFVGPRRVAGRALLAGSLCCFGIGTGCTDEGDLSGSLSDVYRLDHSTVRARLYASELSVEYAREDGSVPVRVTLRRRDQEPRMGTFDLGEVGAITGQLADGTNIPTFLDGTLTLDEFSPEQGAAVVGSFEATFGGQRDTLALSGDFDTSLDLVDWPLERDAAIFTVDAGAPQP